MHLISKSCACRADYTQVYQLVNIVSKKPKKKEDSHLQCTISHFTFKVFILQFNTKNMLVLTVTINNAELSFIWNINYASLCAVWMFVFRTNNGF